MEEKRIYLCEDSLEGIFTAVYRAWEDSLRSPKKHRGVEIYTREPFDREFFCEYIQVDASLEISGKVAASIRRKLGEEVYQQLCHAACCQRSEKGTAIYHTLVEGMGGGRHNALVLENLRNPYVREAANMYRRVWNESHHLLGFVRFRELEQGILFSKIRPDNDVLILLAPHFADRFPLENWMIYDEGRHSAVLHPEGGQWYLRRNLELMSEKIVKMGEESEEYEELWKVFHSHIAVKERKNPLLQRQNLPIRFRSNILEFADKP